MHGLVNNRVAQDTTYGDADSVIGCSRVRAAFSLLEVTFSLSLLAVIMAAIVANMGSLTSSQFYAEEQDIATDVMRHVVEKLQSEDYDDLGDANTYAEPRFQTVGGVPQEGMSPAQLVEFGLLSKEISIDDMQVFVEYYRGVHLDNDGRHVRSSNTVNPGIMQFDDESEADYRLRITKRFLDNDTYVDSMGHTSADYRLTTANDIQNIGLATYGSDGGSTDIIEPICIRVVITWEQGARRIESFTARTADPGSVN